METIFFAVFESKTIKQGVIKHFDKKKSLKEFHYWLENERIKLTNLWHERIVISNIKFIKK